MALPGNVLEFGADPSGSTDSSAAIQAALDSDFSVFFPPGEYRIDTGLVITKAKLIECYGAPMATGYIELGETSPWVPKTLGEQVRIFTTNNIDLITYDAAQIRWYGGCFDVQGVSGHTKSVFFLPIRWRTPVGNRHDGRGIGVHDPVILGNANELRDGLASTTAIKLDFAGQTDIWAFLARGRFSAEVLGCHYGLHFTPRNPVFNHWSNGNSYYITCRDTKVAIKDEGGKQCWAEVQHLARPIFNTQAEADAEASIQIGEDGTIIERPRFRDFDLSESDPTDGYYHNSKTYDILKGGAINNPTQDSLDRKIRIANAKALVEHNLHIYAESGGIALRNATATNLSDIGNAINTNGKQKGTMVFVSDWETNGDSIPIVVAGSGGANKVWKNIATGLTIYTPS